MAGRSGRTAFWLCLLAGFLGALLCVAGAVYGPATRTELFERALLSTVNREAVGTDEASLRAFAGETMAFLTGRKDAWEPEISLYGVPASQAIPESFRAHMRSVRGWVAAVPAVLVGLGLGALLLACLSFFSGGFSARGCLWGVAAAGVLAALLLLWAALDFDSLWMVLHRALIPDGIFAANEPVMQLFPLSLFFSYVGPVMLALGAHLALLLLLIWALGRLCRRAKGTMR